LVSVALIFSVAQLAIVIAIIWEVVMLFKFGDKNFGLSSEDAQNVRTGGGISNQDVDTKISDAVDKKINKDVEDEKKKADKKREKRVRDVAQRRQQIQQLMQGIDNAINALRQRSPNVGSNESDTPADPEPIPQPAPERPALGGNQ